MTISPTLKNALEKKNVTAIRSVLYVIAHENPSLTSGKFYETLKYVKSKNIPGLMEPYDKEPFLPKDKWNEDYWAEVASSLMDNFCDERIKHLAEVGKVVYSDSVKTGPSNSESGSVSNPTHFQKIKASLISVFAKLVNGITSMVRKMKDGRIKKFLLNLLRKAQAGLSRSKSLQAAKPEMAKQLSDSAKEIQEKLNQMQKAQEGFTCEGYLTMEYEIAEEGIFGNFFKKKQGSTQDIDDPKENPRNAEDYFENDLARIDADFWDEISSYDHPIEPVKSKRTPSKEQIQRCQPMIKAMKEFEREATKFVQAVNKICTSREQCFSIINPGKYALHGNSRVGVVHKYIAKYDVPRDVDDCEASINRAFDELENNLFELEDKMRKKYPSIRIELEKDKNNTDCSPLMDEGRFAWMIEFRMIF